MVGCVGAAGAEAEGAFCCPPEWAGGEAGQATCSSERESLQPSPFKSGKNSCLWSVTLFCLLETGEGEA